VVWGVADGDSKFVELAGGDEALGGGEEFGVFDDTGGKEAGVLDDGDKEMGAFDSDERDEKTGIFDDKGEVGVSDDGGGEEAGVFDEGGTEEVGAFDERGGEEMGLFDERGGAGVPDEDVNEVGVWGCEDGIEVGGSSVDAGGTLHSPRRFTPKGHVAVEGDEVEGDEGGWDD
jgi:hypothetical protein